MDPISQLDATGRARFLARILKGLWNGGLHVFDRSLPNCSVCRERVALMKNDGEKAGAPLCQLCFEMMLKTAAQDLADTKLTDDSSNDLDENLA
jgi:hypothetical protein